MTRTRMAAMTALLAAATFPTLASAGAYIGVSGGAARWETNLKKLPGAQNVNNGLAPNAPGDSAINTDYGASEITWNFVAGYMANDYFGVEVGYVDFGEVEQDFELPQDAGTSREWTARIGTTGLQGAVIGALPVSDKVSLYGKLGMISWKGDYEGFEQVRFILPSGGNQPEKADDNGADLFGALGVHLKGDSAFSVRTEFSWYDFDNTDGVLSFTVQGLYGF